MGLLIRLRSDPERRVEQKYPTIFYDLFFFKNSREVHFYTLPVYPLTKCSVIVVYLEGLYVREI